jgi:glycosyltransferase involved in cell wall biosynthesis
MRILLSNHSLFKLGGSETWVRTMYDELVRCGHDVHIYTPVHQLWRDIPDFIPKLHYDLGILNHSNCVKHLAGANIGRRIFTSHGIIPQPEWPIPGCDVYVAVSEEVQASMADRYGVESVVIRNPINLDRFRPTRPLSPVLRRVLFLSNYGWTVAETMAEGAQDLEFRRVGGEHRIENVEEAINWADLVVGLGRSVYEAMACGRNVVVYDYQGADGFVDTDTIYEYRKRNCSGRTNRIKLSPGTFRYELNRYDPSLGPQLRVYAEAHHDVRQIAEEYLSP